MKCRFSADAAIELEQAFDFYNLRSSEAAKRFLDAIVEGADRISESPHRWPQIRHHIRRYRIRRFNYLLIYRTLKDYIEIIAVMHPSRRPGYWKKRS
jgi:toxin ParE1/3/4